MTGHAQPYQRDGSGPRIVGLLGSMRPGNYTGMALNLVRDEVEARGLPFDLVDPSTLRLPLPGQTLDDDDAEALQARVERATGVVFATPEYHGSFSSVTKLLVENLGFPSRLSGKPVALLGVASGSIGAVKSLEQLRGVSSHVGAVVLPGPVSVAKVRTLFDRDGTCTDAATEQRIRGVARTLIDYIDRAICPAISLEAMVRTTVV